MAATVQRKAIEDELQRFTLRVTRRTVPIIFSMMLVQASERRNCAGRPSLLTVRISSNPSRMLFETPGASRSRRWARLRISFSAFAASSLVDHGKIMPPLSFFAELGSWVWLAVCDMRMPEVLSYRGPLKFHYIL